MSEHQTILSELTVYVMLSHLKTWRRDCVCMCVCLCVCLIERQLKVYILLIIRSVINWGLITTAIYKMTALDGHITIMKQYI